MLHGWVSYCVCQFFAIGCWFDMLDATSLDLDDGEPHDPNPNEMENSFHNMVKDGLMELYVELNELLSIPTASATMLKTESNADFNLQSDDDTGQPGGVDEDTDVVHKNTKNGARKDGRTGDASHTDTHDENDGAETEHPSKSKRRMLVH